MREHLPHEEIRPSRPGTLLDTWELAGTLTMRLALSILYATPCGVIREGEMELPVCIRDPETRQTIQELYLA